MCAPIDLYVHTATARGIGAAEPCWAQLGQACSLAQGEALINLRVSGKGGKRGLGEVLGR